MRDRLKRGGKEERGDMRDAVRDGVRDRVERGGRGEGGYERRG